MDREEMTMEQAYDALSALLAKMEQADMSLEENFKLYEEGIGLIKLCHEKLDTMEKQLVVLENGEEAQ